MILPNEMSEEGQMKVIVGEHVVLGTVEVGFHPAEVATASRAQVIRTRKEEVE